jgi:RNA polymerase sigma-70 factor (ECF subfamily)
MRAGEGRLTELPRLPIEGNRGRAGGTSGILAVFQRPFNSKCEPLSATVDRAPPTFPEPARGTGERPPGGSVLGGEVDRPSGPDGLDPSPPRAVENDLSRLPSREAMREPNRQRQPAKTAEVKVVPSTVSPRRRHKNLEQARILATDDRAFKSFTDIWNRRVYNLVLRAVRNPSDAEQITQEALRKFYVALRRFHGKCRLSTFLITIALHLAIDCIRCGRKWKYVHDEDVLLSLSDSAPGPLDLLESEEANTDLQRALREAFGMITPAQALAILLRQGWNKAAERKLPYAVVGRMMGITAAAARARNHAGRLALRGKLRELLSRSEYWCNHKYIRTSPQPAAPLA